MSDYVSLCVLSYERPQFLQRCVESILATADVPFELLIHDDGSTDETVYQYLECLLRADGASRVILNAPGKNEGVGAAVKRLFDFSTGTRLVKIDQDCTFEEGWLSEMVAAFDVQEFRPLGTLGGFRYWADPVDHNKMFRANRSNYIEVDDYVSSVMMMTREIWNQFGNQWETHSAAFAEDVCFKKLLTENGYVHGLTKRDVVVNHGFGLGPSTVVKEDGNVREIETAPLVFAP